MASGPAGSGADLEAIERSAVALAEEAGRLLLDYYRQAIEVEYKDEHRRDPVTKADREIEEYLARAVRERFPDHAVLGEEGSPGEPAAEYLWVIDPVDGTSNFVYHLPFFCVSIAVLHRRRPVVAAIFAPGPAELGGGVYHARLGGGAFLGDRLIKVASPEPKPVRGLVSLPGFAFGMFRMSGAFARSPGDPRTLGSAALELALVAAGVLQYGLFGSLKIWDVAAGVLLVREAGGEVLSWRGWLSGWKRLGAFAAREPSEKDPTGLRGWSEPLLAGGPQVASFVRAGARPNRHALRRLLRRAWRLVRREKPRGKQASRRTAGPPAGPQQSGG